MSTKRKAAKNPETVFANRFPLLDLWANSEGSLEIGEDGNSWVRLLDEGGLVWESQPRKKYKNLDQALSEAQLGLMEWNEDNQAFDPDELEELLEAAQASENWVPESDNYIAVESSMISAMRYSAKTKVLEVVFTRGGV